MENEILQQKFYLSEFSYHNGEYDIKFNIVQINLDKNEIVIAVTDQGKHSLQIFDLKSDINDLYFEYGKMFDKIAINEFEHPQD